MPLYFHCPHCEHPQVIPGYPRRQVVYCRQCGRAYLMASEVRATGTSGSGPSSHGPADLAPAPVAATTIE